MSRLPEDFLYHLLPAYHRERDRPLGGPLRALMATLQEEYALIHRNVEDLYDGWFIETCADWMVPYIGELLGVEGLDSAGVQRPAARRRVANILALRRRKGTRLGLERAATLGTGWPAQVATPPATTVELPTVEAPAAEVRLWRLRSFPVQAAMAARLPSGQWTFHPLGVDSPLFNDPRAPLHSDALVELENLPVPLSPKILAREIEYLRRGEIPPTRFFAPPAALTVFDPDTGAPIAPEAIQIAKLGQSRAPPPTSYEIASPGGERELRPVRVFVDPEGGRLAWPEVDEVPRAVRVSLSYGMSDDVGGGPRSTLAADDVEPGTWQAILGRRAGHSAEGTPVYTDPEGALRAFRASARRRGILWLQGNDTVELGEDPLEVALAEGQELAIRAMAGCRPAMRGNLRILASGKGAVMYLEGFWLGGHVFVSGAVRLELRHATLLPGASSDGSLVLQGGAAVAGGAPARARVRIEDCILGPVFHLAGDCELVVRDSLLDGGGGAVVLLAPSSPAGAVPVRSASRLSARLERATLLGSSRFSVLDLAEDVLFAEPVEVLWPERGRVSNSYVPPGSITPPRHDCVPAADSEDDVKPVFSSRRYGDPAYARLSTETSMQIRAGSSSGSEIGVYGRLRNVDREAALASVFEEFVPWGVRVRGLFMT